MRKKMYSEEQLNIIKEYYPQGDWEKILPFFQEKTKADIRAIARKNGIKRLKDLKKDYLVIMIKHIIIECLFQ